MEIETKTPSSVAHALRLLEACWARGERAPSNDQIHSTVTSKLAREGIIRVEVYGLNWRVIECKRTGRRTQAPPPNLQEPYLILDDIYAPSCRHRPNHGI